MQKPKKVVSQKGKKQVGFVTSAERGELVTVVCVVNAMGTAIPPMIIFPRVRYKEHFLSGAPTGSIGAGSQSGWINESLFVEFLQHIIAYTKCSPNEPILLILDNHESHCSIEAVTLAKEKGVVMLTLPPHTSHRLQPLDKSVYGPFKAYQNQAADGWMRSHPGKKISIYELPQIINEAFLSAMTPRNIIAGFRATGIYPCNRNIFSDADFAPASLSDRPNPNINLSSPLPQTEDALILTEQQPSTSGLQTVSNVMCSDSEYLARSPEKLQEKSSASTKVSVSPAEIIPLPKMQRSSPKARKNRTRVKTRILTNTPEKTADERKSKQNSKKTQQKRCNKRKKVQTIVSSSDESDAPVPLADSSDDDFNEQNCIQDPTSPILIGDFVVVKFMGKTGSRYCIGLIENIDEDDVEARFLHKIPANKNCEKATFAFKEKDERSFPRLDVIAKLPQPIKLGGTARREHHYIFPCSLKD